MLLTEYNEADAKELFKKEGFREGFLEARMSVGEVINYLWLHGRGDDAIKAENDKDLLIKLHEEYQSTGEIGAF